MHLLAYLSHTSPQSKKHSPDTGDDLLRSLTPYLSLGVSSSRSLFGEGGGGGGHSGAFECGSSHNTKRCSAVGQPSLAGGGGGWGQGSEQVNPCEYRGATLARGAGQVQQGAWMVQGVEGHDREWQLVFRGWFLKSWMAEGVNLGEALCVRPNSN